MKKTKTIGICVMLATMLAVIMLCVNGCGNAELKFKLNDDRESYSVVGIGNYKDSNVVIPAQYNNRPVTSIRFNAFKGCENLTSIEIPSSVTSIGNYAFWGCSSLTSITVDDHNQAYLSIDGILFSKDRTILIRYPSGKTEVSYTIPEGVTSIGNYAFYSCDTLTSIEIPSSVMNIGDGAFDDCNNLSSIEMPSSVTSIGNYAFYSCERITSIEIPSSVTRIGRGAFSRCERLTSIEILSSVTSIEIDAFNGCESLTSITYKGTKAQWNQLEKGIRWNNATGDYTIHCTDGDIKK